MPVPVPVKVMCRSGVTEEPLPCDGTRGRSDAAVWVGLQLPVPQAPESAAGVCRAVAEQVCVGVAARAAADADARCGGAVGAGVTGGEGVDAVDCKGA